MFINHFLIISYMKKAVYAGSFDPITNGHLWMIQEGAKLFDELAVAIGVNPDKKYTFSLEERLEMIKKVAKEFANVKIDSFENQYLVNYANAANAKYILRGIRDLKDEKDLKYEMEMRHVNEDLNPNITTVFLIPPRNISEISSSMVKGLIGPEGWESVVENYVPKQVYVKLLEKFKGKYVKWEKLCNRIGLKNTQEIYNSLVSQYSQNHRSYHDLVHIVYLLNEFDEVKNLLNDPDAVEYAIWFHDFIYDTQINNLPVTDNEEKSATLAVDYLNDIKKDAIFVKKVNDLILATKHTIIPFDNDAKYLVDLDLAILGKDKKEFAEYEKGIRDEYIWVPKQVFKEKRREVLKKFYDRKPIYLTEYFREKYEESAKKNLEKALSYLT